MIYYYYFIYTLYIYYYCKYYLSYFTKCYPFVLIAPWVGDTQFGLYIIQIVYYILDHI